MVVHPLTTGDADEWSWVKIGQPFPEGPVRVKGDQNQYVALWYKNGKPVFGRAWNNGGVVECSFPYSGRELTGARDLGGEIQILTYKGDFNSKRFRYAWVPWKDRNNEHFALVRCGQATDMLMKTKSGAALVGNLDLTTEVATVAENGKEEKQSGGQLADNLVVVRVHCDCHESHHVDPWMDLRIHDPVPSPDLLVRAGDKKINTGDGRLVEHFVALWYKNGEPVFGRAWGYKGDTIEASFGILGKEFTGGIGSIQVPIQHHAVEYKWVPYADCVGESAPWKPFRVKDAAPCLIKNDKGHEKLGCVWMSQGKASCGWAGLEELYTGGVVKSFLVLCRRNR